MIKRNIIMYQAITYNVITKLNEYEYYDFLENGYK